MGDEWINIITRCEFKIILDGFIDINGSLTTVLVLRYIFVSMF